MRDLLRWLPGFSTVDTASQMDFNFATIRLREFTGFTIGQQSTVGGAYNARYAIEFETPCVLLKQDRF
jgi:hypothetical protein